MGDSEKVSWVVRDDVLEQDDKTVGVIGFAAVVRREQRGEMGWSQNRNDSAKVGETERSIEPRADEGVFCLTDTGVPGPDPVPMHWRQNTIYSPDKC